MMELSLMASIGTLAHKGEPVSAIPTMGDWAVEPKYDGWWIAAHRHADGVTFYTRAGNIPPGKLQAVKDEIMAAVPPDSWLAGEMVALKPQPDGSILNVWGDAQSALTTTGYCPAANAVTYMVFDLLASAGLDARSLSYATRRKLLAKVFAEKAFKRIGLTPSFPASAGRHKHLVKVGFEGSMLKRLDAPYASGKKGHGLLKWKHEATEDVVVMGFEAGKDVGAVVFGQFVDGKLVQRGTCKRKPTLIPTPDLMAWAGKVIEVKHNGVMPSGALRHPSMERVRIDKTAKECVWDES